MNLKITVQGRVQGVFYRASTRDKARELGLNGFVRNESNGDVYIEAEGEEEILKKFIAWCKQGPRQARVDNLKIIEGEDQGHTKFEIRRW